MFSSEYRYRWVVACMLTEHFCLPGSQLVFLSRFSPAGSTACTAKYFVILLFPRLVSLEFFLVISFVGPRCYWFYPTVTQPQLVSSSLELASKNILCGSVKMVYALIYTLFLGFGLQIGSDLYLLFDANTRHHLASLDAAMSRAIIYTGNFAVDSGALTLPGVPSIGSFTFTNGSAHLSTHMRVGCFRPPEYPWFLQPFPFWSQFITVPLFSTLSSLSNLQPWHELDLVVMVVISCVSFAANKAANHFIFNRSDIVSAIGAFAVGLFGNIYSRMFGGTAFTVMVTGVLFLVPVRVAVLTITSRGHVSGVTRRLRLTPPFFFLVSSRDSRRLTVGRSPHLAMGLTLGVL